MDGCVEGCVGSVWTAVLRVMWGVYSMDGCVEGYVGSIGTAVLRVKWGVC